MYLVRLPSFSLADRSRNQKRRRQLRLEKLDRREPFAIDPFTIAVLPDTQFYAQSYPAIFDAQTQWIVDNLDAEKIAFVTHEGDIVQSAETGANRNLLQWQRADHSIDILDGNLTQNPNGLVPYSVAIGNHDYGRTSDKSFGTARYREFFGAHRYEGRTWYGGDSHSGLSHFQIFEAGDWRFLHLALEWEPAPEELTWAQSVIDDHQGYPTIITTHSYLNPSTRNRTSTSTDTGPSSSGEQVFQQLVRPNPQIFMVLNGHFSGEYQRLVMNGSGQAVLEMVADFQSRSNGGDGWLRLISFDADASRIQVRTYSPVLNAWETDGNSQFSYQIDLNARFGESNLFVPQDPGVQTSTFRQGVAGYSSVVDAQVKQHTSSTAYGRSTHDLLVDASVSGQRNASHVLLRFEQFMGNAPGQIPPNANVLSAELILNTINPGDGGTLHRMRKEWDGGSTWNYLGAGVTADGEEAISASYAQVGSNIRSPNVPTGPTVVNVTADVQAWLNGAANEGWVVLPWVSGTDGWGFSPSEDSHVQLRPQLRVEWIPAGSMQVSSFQHGVNNYIGSVDTTLASNAASARQDSNPLITIDGPVDNTTRAGLLVFNDIFGDAARQIPIGAQIVWARLYLTTPSGIAHAAGGGAKLHRSLIPWSASATWNNAFGGNGVQTDGVEATIQAELDTGNQTIGTRGFDVTTSLREWKAGAANHGWLFRHNTSDAWMFGSAEQEVLSNRPRLVIGWSL